MDDHSDHMKKKSNDDELDHSDHEGMDHTKHEKVDTSTHDSMKNVEGKRARAYWYSFYPLALSRMWL